MRLPPDEGIWVGDDGRALETDGTEGTEATDGADGADAGATTGDDSSDGTGMGTVTIFRVWNGSFVVRVIPRR